MTQQIEEMCIDNTANGGNSRKRKCVEITQQREEMCIEDTAGKR